MVRRRFAALATLIAVALISLATSASAQTGNWTVISVSGSVRGAPDVASGLQVLAAGDSVGGSAVVVTGPGSRAVIERNGDEIEIAPNTRVELQPETNSTWVLQSVGRAVYNIVTGGGPRFEVRTPFLVAGVKGTVFSVTVAADRADVAVSEGIVGVTPPSPSADFQSADVTPGQSASVAFGVGGAGLSINVDDTPAGQDPESVRGATPPNASQSNNGNGAANGNGGRGNSQAAEASRGNGGNGNNAGGNGNGNGNGFGLTSVDEGGGNAGGNGGGNAGGNGGGNAGGNGGGNAGGNGGGNGNGP